MKEFDPVREFIFDYITVVAENTLAIAVIGSIFVRDASISFVYFFLPFVLALICMIPCIPIYLKEDMTVKQILLQRGIELVVLEVAMCLAIRFVMGESFPEIGYVAIFDYITVVAENTLAIAVIGSIFVRDASISFVYFFLPFVLALICMIPCIPIYLKEDMTVKQILLQRGIELVVLEVAMCLAIRFVMGESFPEIGYVAILISTAFFDVLSYLIKWYLEKEEADKINRKIEEYRRKKNNE